VLIPNFCDQKYLIIKSDNYLQDQVILNGHLSVN